MQPLRRIIIQAARDHFPHYERSSAELSLPPHLLQEPAQAEDISRKAGNILGAAKVHSAPTIINMILAQARGATKVAKHRAAVQGEHVIWLEVEVHDLLRVQPSCGAYHVLAENQQVIHGGLK